MASFERQLFNHLDEFRGAPSIVDGEEGRWYRPRQAPIQGADGTLVGGDVKNYAKPSDEELAKFELAREKFYEFWNAFRAAVGEPPLAGGEYEWTEERYERERRAREARKSAASYRPST